MKLSVNTRRIHEMFAYRHSYVHKTNNFVAKLVDAVLIDNGRIKHKLSIRFVFHNLFVF